MDIQSGYGTVGSTIMGLWMQGYRKFTLARPSIRLIIPEGMNYSQASNMAYEVECWCLMAYLNNRI